MRLMQKGTCGRGRNVPRSAAVELSLQTSNLDLERDGAERFRGGVRDQLDAIANAISSLPHVRGGLRLFGIEALRPLLHECGAVGSIAASLLHGVRPVRAILFDKTESSNWALGWHQDRTIAVAERREVEGFGPWTLKGGMHHVSPPFELLERMITLRVHLDEVPDGNAPLLIARGSHLLGQIPERRIDEVVAGSSIDACLAEAGDVWAYATPILHASRRATRPVRRRVLQVDYSADTLPGGLRWRGI
jgi:hypothetical protein